MDATEIVKIRESLCFTRDEFAELLGVDATTIWRWEMGKSRPDKYLEGFMIITQQVISKNDGLKLKEALIIGGHLLAIHTVLKQYFDSGGKNDG